jgi:hypothetical protein
VSERVIAVTHPGKRGDCLYALPAARRLCYDRAARCDFYTSEHCRNLGPLIGYQSFVRRFVVSPGYRMEHAGCGVQPWQMPVPEDGYDAVFHLGYRSTPDRPLPDYIAASVGLPGGLPIHYDCPLLGPDSPLYVRPGYVVLAGCDLSAAGHVELVESCRHPVVQVGAAGERVSTDRVIDRTGCDYLQECSLIAGSLGFVGGSTSHLVCANGFYLTRLCVHSGGGDSRHFVRSPLNHYLVNPTAAEVVDCLNRLG